MRAARRFAEAATAVGANAITRVAVELFGSLGHTGKGHGSDRAIILGLEGETPESVNPGDIDARVANVRATSRLHLSGNSAIEFVLERDLVFNRREQLAAHANGMRFRAFAGDRCILTREYYSVGGGFIVEEGQTEVRQRSEAVRYPFHSAAELLALGRAHGISISDIMWANETAWRSDVEVRARLVQIWQAMQACVRRGCETEGQLPGGLQLERRAPALYRRLRARTGATGARFGNIADSNSLSALDWVNLYALAVNEENAAGGRVVTAPTNGAAGIVPAVLHYYANFHTGANENDYLNFLLTAGAIGILYKENASISGAEVGCQGEVGVACSMAAGALAQALGGSIEQVENAAEIGMEHNLGLTCDPIGGLVQIPCIERNAMGAVKAINAARLALQGDGKHRVSLDKVIATMRQTGADMSQKYKETSRGGLAVSVIEC